MFGPGSSRTSIALAAVQVCIVRMFPMVGGLNADACGYLRRMRYFPWATKNTAADRGSRAVPYPYIAVRVPDPCFAERW